VPVALEFGYTPFVLAYLNQLITTQDHRGLLNLTLLSISKKDDVHFGRIVSHMYGDCSEILESLSIITSNECNLLHIYLNSISPKRLRKKSVELILCCAAKSNVKGLESIIKTFIKNEYTNELIKKYTRNDYLVYGYDVVHTIYSSMSTITDLLLTPIVYAKLTPYELITFFTKIIPKEKVRHYINAYFKISQHQELVIYYLPSLVMPDIFLSAYAMSRGKQGHLDIIKSLPADFPYTRESFIVLGDEALRALLRKRGMTTNGRKVELRDRLTYSY
jgi:hypothetical protein